jgi:hypothetical protein
MPFAVAPDDASSIVALVSERGPRRKATTDGFGPGCDSRAGRIDPSRSDVLVDRAWEGDVEPSGAHNGLRELRHHRLAPDDERKETLCAMAPV